LSQEKLGLRKGTVRLVKYQPDWPAYYEEAKQNIQKAGGDAILEMHHIGSTAVPNMPAKPIIDVLAVVKDMATAHALIPALEKAGYVHQEHMKDEDKLFFTHGTEATHHLHIIGQDCARLPGYLRFRDALRDNPELAQEYIQLKQDLAARFPHDRKSYTEAKDAFIKTVISGEAGNGRGKV
jgi:GrpB-like predicted nucleotidyltransferase (UPF0157 family)